MARRMLLFRGMKIRPIWPILGITALGHVAVFWCIKGILLFDYTRTARPIAADFTAREIPAIIENNKVVQPAEKQFTVSTHLFDSPAASMGSRSSALPPLLASLPEEPSLDLIKTSQRRVSVFNLQTETKRVVYLVDASGSMWKKFNKQTRFDMARNEVLRSIKSLPPDVQFNVIYFANGVSAFSTESVYASDRAKKEVEAFLKEPPELRGETDLMAGLGTALKMGPDSVFLLTDGIANVPESEVLGELKYFKTKFQVDPKIYALGFDLKSEPEGEALLKRLTDQSHGSYQPVMH